MPQLTGRDKSLLVDLFQYRLLTVSQIARLHFPNSKKARERLKILHDGRLVDRFTPYRTFLKQEHVYLLKLRGARVVAKLMGKSLGELVWRHKEPRKFSFLRHFLTVNDFRIALTLACKDAGLSQAFIPEYSLYRKKGGKAFQKAVGIFSPVSQRPFIPDGVFCLENPVGKKLLFFLEVDIGTEPLRLSSGNASVLSKLLAYADYFDGGDYAFYSKNFVYPFRGFRVLWVTSSEERLKHIQNMCLDTDVWSFVWLTSIQNATLDKLLAEIWFVPGFSRTCSIAR